jgi:hypothetical protein
MIEQYGVEHGFQSQEIQGKIKQTMIERFGVENPSQSKEIREKAKQTMIYRYGVEHPSHSEELQMKKEHTLFKNFGVKNPFQSKEIREKAKQTMIDHYRVENPSQSEEIQQKKIDTSFAKYNCRHPMHDSTIADKCSKNAYKAYDYIFPSGRIDRIQGYEHFALDELLKEYDENDIITMKSDVPEIWYVDEEQKHRHYVDIFIKSKQLCIEVKSTWTAEKKNDNIFLKQNAGKELGYQYEIWIYDAKGNKVKCYK